MKNILKKISATLAILAILGMSTASAGVQNREVQLVINGNFNDTNITFSSGVGGWTTVSTGLTSSVIDDPDMPENKILEVKPDSTTSYVYQVVSGMTANSTYRVRGRAKTLSGGGVPRIYMDGDYVWIGDSPGVTTEWQYFDFYVTPMTYNFIRLYSSTSVGGKSYFDDISVTPYYGTVQNRDVNLIADGNMEASGTTSWYAGTAVITKEVGAGNVTGTQYLRVQRKPSGAVARSYTTLTSGLTYRITGQARGDGTNFPAILKTSQAISGAPWIGTNSTTWQFFDVLYTPDLTGALYLYAGATNDNWAEYDNISVTPYYGTVQNRDTALGTDLNFEKAGTADFVAVYANLTKETNDKGDEGEQFLRITYNGGAGNAYALQNLGLDTSAKYRIRGKFRTGSATYACRLIVYGGNQLEVTTSTDWVTFDKVFTPVTVSIGLGSMQAGGVGSYCDYDNVSITRVY